MTRVFHGWRPKVGIASLLIALFLMGCWVRSFSIQDGLELPFGKEVTIGCASCCGSIYFHPQPSVNGKDYPRWIHNPAPRLIGSGPQPAFSLTNLYPPKMVRFYCRWGGFEMGTLTHPYKFSYVSHEGGDLILEDEEEAHLKEISAIASQTMGKLSVLMDELLEFIDTLSCIDWIDVFTSRDRSDNFSSAAELFDVLYSLCEEFVKTIIECMKTMPATGIAKQQWLFFKIPYWICAMPWTVSAACLLLIKPRSAKPQPLQTAA